MHKVHSIAWSIAVKMDVHKTPYGFEKILVGLSRLEIQSVIQVLKIHKYYYVFAIKLVLITELRYSLMVRAFTHSHST